MTAAVIRPPDWLTAALPGAYQGLMSDMDLRQHARKADGSEQPEMAKFSLRVMATCDTEQGHSHNRSYLSHAASYPHVYR